MRDGWRIAFTVGAVLALGACREEQGARPPAAPAPAESPAPQPARDEPLGALSVPDVELVDQEGRTVHLTRELAQGRTVAVSFIFTRCTTICPPLGLVFSRLQALLGERAGKQVQLLSISLDPEYDTPERLQAWGQQFGAGPGWRLLRGSKSSVDQLLKALTVYTPVREEHAPVILVGNMASGEWVRTAGLASPSRLLEVVNAVHERAQQAAALPSAPGTAPTSASQEDSAARRYFTDTELVDQHGQRHRFYEDLIRGRVVVIHVFFSRCTGSCPVMAGTALRLQEWLGERLGREAYVLSLSVDPERDTPERLAEYAQRFKARPGWYFLTGARPDMERVLQKLGMAVQRPDDHKALFIIGNERTGLWKKAFGLARAEEVLRTLESVLEDRGSEEAKAQAAARP